MTLRHRGYLVEGASSLSRNDVVDILAQQPNNAGKSREMLARWAVSDNFRLTSIYVALNDLGISPGKTGQTQSKSKPIIVDKNERMVARSFQGIGGAAPDFIVLDGQNRVVLARKKSIRGKLKAYVGNKIYSKVEAANKIAEKKFLDVEKAIKDFLNTPSMPGGKLMTLERFVKEGLLSQKELDSVRQKWRKKYGNK